MKTSILTIALFACIGAANASSPNGGWTMPPHHDDHHRGQRQKQDQDQRQKQQQQQQQKAVSKSSAAGGSVGDTTATGGSVGDTTATGGDASNTISIAGDTSERSVASASAPLVFPTADCMGGGGLGAQGAGFGFSIGGGKVMPGCEMRANAQMLNALGENDAALRLMCQDASVAKAMPARCGR